MSVDMTKSMAGDWGFGPRAENAVATGVRCALKSSESLQTNSMVPVAGFCGAHLNVVLVGDAWHPITDAQPLRTSSCLNFCRQESLKRGCDEYRYQTLKMD